MPFYVDPVLIVTRLARATIARVRFVDLPATVGRSGALRPRSRTSSVTASASRSSWTSSSMRRGRRKSAGSAWRGAGDTREPSSRSPGSWRSSSNGCGWARTSSAGRPPRAHEEAASDRLEEPA